MKAEFTSMGFFFGKFWCCCPIGVIFTLPQLAVVPARRGDAVTLIVSTECCLYIFAEHSGIETQVCVLQSLYVCSLFGAQVQIYHLQLKECPADAQTPQNGSKCGSSCLVDFILSEILRSGMKRTLVKIFLKSRESEEEESGYFLCYAVSVWSNQSTQVAEMQLYPNGILIHSI